MSHTRKLSIRLPGIPGALRMTVHMLRYHVPQTDFPTTWDFTPLFNSDSDPKMDELRRATKKAHVAFEKHWKGTAKYLEDGHELYKALTEYEILERKFASNTKEAYYFWLQSALDNGNTKYKARVQKTIDFSHELQDHVRFFTQTLAKLSPQQQGIFLHSPLLAPYHHFLTRLFASAKFLLSESEERIMELKSTSAHMLWENMVEESFARQEWKGKSFSQIMALLSDAHKATRDEAAAVLNDIFCKQAFVCEAELNAILGDKKADDLIRHVARPDLIRHLDDDIETETVDTMLDVVTSHFDIAKRYYQLKAKLFGVKQLAYHERGLEYGKTQKKYTFAQATDLVHDVFSTLDPEFAQIFTRFLENGQIDVYPKKGKSAGAFCTHNLLDDPTYILLNYTDKLVDVTTLAHESGHGINNELVRAKQHALYFETPTSTAEVASTFMEDFVILRLSRDLNDEEKLSLLISKLDSDISTIFRQVACYRFEQELHRTFREKGHLSHEEIGLIFQKHMAAYMGDGVEMSPGSENWWMYWTHIRAFFYVYSYASGLLISKSLQASVKKNPSCIAQVKEFLSAGSSLSARDIFLPMGIDIAKKAFWEIGIQEVADRLGEATAIAKKLGKI